MARFFIDQPIFAWVIAIVIMLGALSIQQLPVSQYPTIAPPTVVINASYPGASAKGGGRLGDADHRAEADRPRRPAVHESTSDAGNSGVTLTFEAGTDPDIAQVQVQNKMQLAAAAAAGVQQQGVTVAKSAMNFLMVVGFWCRTDKR